MSTDIATASTPTTPDNIWRPSAAINPQRLDYLWGLAERIASSALVPLTLQGKVGRGGTLEEKFPPETIVANVFAVVEQADRWNYSPFALLSCAAIVYGKLGFEGKVINSVLETSYGIQLHAYYQGEPGTDHFRIFLCDEELPPEVVANLEPQNPPEGYRVIDGSVGEWKTTSSGSPWSPKTYTKMLNYRGAREWARVYKPAAILGVVADDELQQLALEQRAAQAIDRTPASRKFAERAASAGFSPDNVAKALEHNPQVTMDLIDSRTGEVVESGAQRTPEVFEAQAASKADEATASQKPTEYSAGGGGEASKEDSRPQISSEVTPAPPAPPAQVFLDYHGALARMETAENVKRAHASFWKGKGISLAEGSDARQLAVDIYDNHLARVGGKVPADMLATEVANWVKAYEEKQL